MIFFLECVDPNNVPPHVLSDVALAVEQSLARYGKSGRVLIEADLLQRLLEELEDLDRDYIDPDAYTHNDDVETVKEELNAYKDQLPKFKALLLDFVERVQAYQKNLPKLVQVDAEVKEKLERTCSETVDELKRWEETLKTLEEGDA